MRRIDHERIAEVVALIEPRHFSSVVLDSLKQGSVKPDDFDKRRAHHYGRSEDIKKHLVSARVNFLRGEVSRSAFELGIAFHYIADATCPPSSKFGVQDTAKKRRIQERHRVWEQEISHCMIPKVRTARIETAEDIEGFLNSLYVESSPRSALTKAVCFCASFLELTWRPLSDKTVKDEEVIKKAQMMMPKTSLVVLIWLLAMFVSGTSLWLTLIEKFFHLGLSIIFVLFVLSTAGVFIEHLEEPWIWILKWYGLR